MHITLRFHGGSLVLHTSDRDAARDLEVPANCVWDDRNGRWRAPAHAYREVFADLHRRARTGDLTLVDEARAYEPLTLTPRSERTPRDYQLEAIQHWERAGRRGVVVLPTGAGKSFVAHLAIQSAGRSALIVVPTLDLMHQWYSGFLAGFSLEDVGLLGGGSHDIRPLTVTTYDSAALHMERYGDRFGLLIFDECHHLPGPTYLQAARNALAPFRLGLTATPERQDGREALLDEVVGPICFRRDIRDLAGGVLSGYDVERIAVTLTDDEYQTYTDNRERYRDFVRRNGIRFDRPNGWGEFIQKSSRTVEGRQAMRAFQTQRRIALTCSRKLTLVHHLLVQHAGERVIVFTNDNETVYTLSRQLLLPCITHQTPVRERREILDRFRNGTWPVVVTSRVLNEGVDVPEASVAIVLSGTGSVREHVQRLGRVLRPAPDKRAMLYEVITAGTVEERVSERRREHEAYRDATGQDSALEDHTGYPDDERPDADTDEASLQTDPTTPDASC